MPSVLIVEDDVPTQLLLRQILERYQNKVIGIAANGKVALEMLSQRVPDVILLDVKMPVMDGMEFLKAFEKTTAAQRAKVVILTAATVNAELTREAYGRGVSEILSKPFTPIGLNQCLIRITSGSTQ